MHKEKRLRLMQECLKRFLVGSGRQLSSKLTRAEVLALQVVYGNDDQARGSWDQYRATEFDIDSLYLYSGRGILPLLSKRVSKLFPDDPWLGRMKGLYRYTWTKNQFQLNTLSAVLRAFHESSIRSIVISDAAILLTHAGDIGLKAIEDQAVLVSFLDHDRAAEIAREVGGVSPATQTGPERQSVRVCRSIYGVLHNLAEQDSLTMNIAKQEFTILAAPELLLSLFLAINYDEPNQSQWFMDTALMLNSCSSDNEIERFMQKVESLRMAKPVIQAWEFFKQLAQSVYFDTESCKIAARLEKTPVKINEIAKRVMRLK